MRQVLRRRIVCTAESLRDALETDIETGHLRPVDALLDLILKGGLTATPAARETTS